MVGPEKRKVTFVLAAQVVDGVRELVDAGEAPSQSSFVEEAVREELGRRRRDRLRARYAEAAADPAFIADVEAVTRDFRHADRDVEGTD